MYIWKNKLKKVIRKKLMYKCDLYFKTVTCSLKTEIVSNTSNNSNEIIVIKNK